MRKNVILTHYGQISDFSMLDKKHNIYHFPMINIKLKKINILKLTDYDYFIFTSKNGVDSFVNSYNNNLKSIKTICAGKKLYEKIKNLGFSISHYTESPFKENLIDDLIKSTFIKNKKIIYLTGNLSNNFIEEKLKNHCQIARENIYITTHVKKINNELEDILNNNNCVLIFTSPSAFDSFSKKYKLKNHKIGVIGKSTMKHIRDNNHKVDFISSNPSYNDLCIKINNYLNQLN